MLSPAPPPSDDTASQRPTASPEEADGDSVSRVAATPQMYASWPAEAGMVEPVIVRFGLHIAPRAPVGGREADGVEPPVLHHLQIRVGAVQHAVHPPLENPVRVRPGGVLDVDLDAMPLAQRDDGRGHVRLIPLPRIGAAARVQIVHRPRSEEHTSELQSRLHLVCRLLLEKKKTKTVEHLSRKLIKSIRSV